MSYCTMELEYMRASQMETHEVHQKTTDTQRHTTLFEQLGQMCGIPGTMMKNSEAVPNISALN